MTSALAPSRNSNVVEPIVAASIASLKVTVMLPVCETPVAPLAGERALIVGGVVSPPVPTVTDRLVGVPWMLPLSSTARLRIVAAPLAVGVQV